MIEEVNTTEVSQIESLLEKIGDLSDAVLHKKTNEKIHEILADIAEQVRINTPKIKTFLIYSFQDGARREILKLMDIVLYSPKENKNEIQWIKKIMIKNRQNIQLLLSDKQLINVLNSFKNIFAILKKTNNRARVLDEEKKILEEKIVQMEKIIDILKQK